MVRLIARLPDHSHYKVAIHDDDELAVRRRDTESPGRLRLSRVDARTWTPERATLTDIADILLTIRASLEAQRTGKRQKPPVMPRPVLAADRLERTDFLRRHRERVRLLLPDSRG